MGNGAAKPVGSARCALCGEPILPGQGVERDHIVPISWGGVDGEWNVQIVHRSCNRRRNAGFTPAQLPLTDLPFCVDSERFRNRRESTRTPTVTCPNCGHLVPLKQYKSSAERVKAWRARRA